MRVLVTGMGGELGTRVAQLLEDHDEIDEIAGVDFVPPRRRLRRSSFRRIDPRDRERLVEFVTEFEPTAVAHLGVYEPHARSSPRTAAELTESCALAALGAAARTGVLDRVVVRSGIEVYGRGRGLPDVPDEAVPPEPGTHFGASCLAVEVSAARLGRRHDYPVGLVRLAPVVGSHVPSPLGRLLRLPAVPVPVFDDPAFSMVHPEDAAHALVAALVAAHDGPLNVVGTGAASPWQAVRLGNRVPVPVFGAGWAVAARVAEVAGAPVPSHVIELLRSGRTADGTRALEALHLPRPRPVQQICSELYEWATVTPLRPTRAVA